jgi:antitoxin HicB
MIGYRIKLAPDDNGTLLVTCPQLPIVATFGADKVDAMRHAIDAIEMALASMIEDGDEIPKPDRNPGPMVRLSLMTALKLQIYWALRESNRPRKRSHSGRGS